jgi:hypothetical protein
MNATLPLGDFLKQRREELGFKSMAEYARQANTNAVTIRAIEERTDAPEKVYKATWNGIATALKLSPEKLLAATRTWVANPIQLVLSESGSIPDTHPDQNPTGIPLTDFLRGRTRQLGFKSMADLASTTGKSNDRQALRNLMNERTDHKTVSKPFFDRIAKALKLQREEFLLTIRTGIAYPEKLCTTLPYQEADAVDLKRGSRYYKGDGVKLPGASTISMPLLHAIVESGDTRLSLINRLSDLEEYAGFPFSKDTFACLIKDVSPTVDSEEE